MKKIALFLVVMAVVSAAVLWGIVKFSERQICRSVGEAVQGMQVRW